MTRKTQDPESPNAEAPVTPADDARPKAALGRRSFLGVTGSLAVAGASAGLGAIATHAPTTARADEPRSEADTVASKLDEAGAHLRRDTLELRSRRAKENYDPPLTPPVTNGDEARYPNKIGTDTRGLPHDDRGEVNLEAFALYKRALDSQDPADFDRIPLGGTRKLANTLGSVALSLTGAAQAQIRVPPSPALASAERAADAVELYWQALLRDVPFSEYRNDTRNELVLAAAAELSRLPGFTGPRDAAGNVTPELLFRGTVRTFDPSDPTGQRARTVPLPGVLTGPYLSQFLLRDVPYGTQFIGATIRAPSASLENDFLTTHEEWLANQNGKPATRTTRFDATRRYISNGRDLAVYASGGSPAFAAAELLLAAAASTDASALGGLGARTTPANPYNKLKTTASGTSTWGQPYVQSILYLARSREQRVAYWNKNIVHRTLRPEAFGGLVNQVLQYGAGYPLHEDVLRSDAVARTHAKFGSYLLPSAIPDAAPLHGSYPGGGSSTAGTHATVLKAFYDESFVIPDPVQPHPTDPTRLVPYDGPPLTVGGELNKLASNIGIGRNWAAVHWRSDAGAGLFESEQFVISLLRDERYTFREPFDGFQFTRFDGTPVTV